jgi:hypothetical protein
MGSIAEIDNFETGFLVNDIAASLGERIKPWQLIVVDVVESISSRQDSSSTSDNVQTR